MHTNQRLAREASDGVAELWRAISRVLPGLHFGQTATLPPPASLGAGEEPSSNWNEFMEVVKVTSRRSGSGRSSSANTRSADATDFERAPR
jgi:hypothetical protein